MGGHGGYMASLGESLDSLREGLQILSPEWRYLYVNEAVARHGRKRRDELLGRTMLECYPGIDTTPMFAVLRRCMEAREATNLENEFVHADGQRDWFELRIEPCHEGLIVLSLDITARKQMEARLAQHQKLRALGQMAAGVSHDLKNLLNPLTLDVALLQDLVPGNEPAQNILEQMTRVLRRGSEVIDLLGDVGRQEPREAAPIEVNPIVHEAAQLARPRIGNRGRTLTIVEELKEVPRVAVSASEILTAVLNLLANAIDASERGRIYLRTAPAGEGVAIEVEDSGCGMTPEVEARALEPFFTTKGDQGTGLGLAMVYALAARQGGSLRVRTAPGAGTTITLLLPPAGEEPWAPTDPGTSA
jgi:PAS domain S-box-containing protein